MLGSACNARLLISSLTTLLLCPSGNLLVYYTLLITAFAVRDCATSQASSLRLSSLFSVRVHVLKKVIVIDLIDKNGIHLVW